MIHPTKRQLEILRTVKLQGTCLIGDLASSLKVSDETIRRDVRVLADEGMIIKLHGAVVALDSFREDPFQVRLEEHRQDKLRIARLAAELINDGDTIMLDTGSTTAYLAQCLADHRNLITVTNSIEVARSLPYHNGNRVYMAGGEIRADDGAAFDVSAINFAAQFRVNKAILSIAAISAKGGLMDSELWEADYSKVVIDQADQIIVVADHSKFGRQALVKVCSFSDIDILVTSAPPPSDIAACLAENGVDIIIG